MCNLRDKDFNPSDLEDDSDHQESGSDNSDEEPDEAEEEGKKKKFDFRAKNLGLTYPQFDIPLSVFTTKLKKHMTDEDIPFVKLVVGREDHPGSDGKHFHVYIGFSKRWHTRNVRAMDINDNNDNPKHPNWCVLKKPINIDKWISYCKKMGEFVQEGFMENLFTFKHHTNYRKNKADLTAWESDAKKQALKDPFPFLLPNGQEVKEPQPGNKKCNYLIYGPPDIGKTYWCQMEFQGKKVYMRPDKKNYFFESGAYSQEPVIVYDDIVMKQAEIIDVSNCWMLQKEVYGESRYTPNYWKIGQRRVIIWLMNEERLPDWAIKGNERYDIFKARFNFLKASKSDDGNVRWTLEDDVLSARWGPMPETVPEREIIHVD